MSARLLLPALSCAVLLWPTQPARAQFVQDGPKLVSIFDPAGNARQGWSVAVSGNGHTAIVGGYEDNGGAGAAWVFIRVAKVWNQEGPKLVGNNAVGVASQGSSVALSADGNTAIVGGLGDGNFTGAAWVYTRSGGVCCGTWSQQAKLVGNNPIALSSSQGYSVALSADGNTAIVGGPGDNNDAGAAWVFTRSGGVWTQQGTKLVGTGGSASAFQGGAAALSCNTAIEGGPIDNSNVGAAWVFLAPPTNAHDVNGDCLSDILWRDGAGNLAGR